MFWTKNEITVSASLITKTYINDLKEVTNKWTRKIETGDILEFDDTRLKMDFMILRSKLDFINKLDLFINVELLMDSLDDLEGSINGKIKKAILRMFSDQPIEALNKPLFK